jgi:hypothetical protein
MAEKAKRRPRFNHVAMSVPADALDGVGRDDLLRFYEEVFGFTEMPGLTVDRARKYREKDERVEIIEPQTEDYKVLELHNFYVRYRLPLMIEVQRYEWAEGVDDQSLPRS